MINTRKPSCVVGSWPASWPAGRRAAPTPDARAADAEAEAVDPGVSRPAPAELPKLRLTAAAWPAASMGAWPPPRRERRSHQVGRRLDLCYSRAVALRPRALVRSSGSQTDSRFSLSAFPSCFSYKHCLSAARVFKDIVNKIFFMFIESLLNNNFVFTAEIYTRIGCIYLSPIQLLTN